jgi:RHS repeat-associated protein
MRRRTRKEFTWTGSWTQTNEVRYVYDGNLVIQERDANNLPSVTYTRGKDLSGSLQGAGGIGGLLARTDNSLSAFAVAFYHADGNGNVTALINASQQIAAKYLYDPFGNTISKSGVMADANVYRFSGKEIHVASGMYYYGYRFYDPSLQRWSNRDPSAEAGGSNLFAYVTEDPINRYDAFGLACVKTTSGAGKFNSNLWAHNLPPQYPPNVPGTAMPIGMPYHITPPGPASSLTFNLRCPKCAPNLMDFQVGFLGKSPPVSGTLHGNSFPDSWTTVSITSLSDTGGALHTIVINVTSTTSLANDLGISSSIAGVFIDGLCCDAEGPPHRIPGLKP